MHAKAEPATLEKAADAVKALLISTQLSHLPSGLAPSHSRLVLVGVGEASLGTPRGVLKA